MTSHGIVAEFLQHQFVAFSAAFVALQFCCLKQGWGDPLPSWPMQRSGHEVGVVQGRGHPPPVACISPALWLHLNPAVGSKLWKGNTDMYVNKYVYMEVIYK